jgi:hypothetical protein
VASGPEPISDLVSRLRLKGGARDLCALWGRAVPKPWAAHTRPVGLHAGVLTVEVDSAVVLHELELSGREGLLGRAREVFGPQLRSIRFVPGGGHG